MKKGARWSQQEFDNHEKKQIEKRLKTGVLKNDSLLHKKRQKQTIENKNAEINIIKACAEKSSSSTKKSKYRNTKVIHGTEVFDSKKEFNRYLELKQKEGRREIMNLHRQVVFYMELNGVKICKYVADFVYTTLSIGANDIPEPDDYVVEDVKSEVTRKLPAYRLKKKLMAAFHNIQISEV